MRDVREFVVRALLMVLLLGSAACTALPEGKSSIDAVDVRGTDLGSEAEDKIATRPTTRFLGLFKGVFYEYEVFDRYVLERDLLRVERFLKSRGYYDARVRAAEVVPLGEGKVRVQIDVQEGEAVRVARIDVVGLEGLPPKVVKEATYAIRDNVKEGEPLDEEAFEKSGDSLVKALTDRGYARAKIEREAEIDLPNHRAFLKYSVAPSSACRFGPIRFEGLEKDLPEGPLRLVLGFKEGDPYSTEVMDDAEQSLLDLGVFVAADINADTSGSSDVIPVTVRVEVGKLKAVLLGVGAEFDTSRTDLHVQAGWSHLNLFGGLRNFEVKAQPGVVLYPLRTNNLVSPEHYLPTLQTRATLKRPAFFEAKTTGILDTRLRVLPELRPLGAGQTDVNVPGYTEIGASPGLSRPFGKVFVNPLYNASYYIPFDYVNASPVQRDPLFVSYVDLFAYLDLRDDATKTKKGFYFQNSLQFAGGIFGGDANDIRVDPEARGFIPFSRRVTLALRGSVGFLFPSNYGKLARANANGETIAQGAEKNLARDYQIYYVRSFFSGGASSNRGYPYNGVSPYAVVPYLNPSQSASSSCAAELRSTDRNLDCQVPTGGLSNWEATIEPRFDVVGPFSLVTFCDASDVSPDTLNLRFNRPHLSCGGGARYDTPVGPIRLDIAYRIPGVQVPGQSDGEGNPGKILGVPLGIAFGIGEAF